MFKDSPQAKAQLILKIFHSCVVDITLEYIQSRIDAIPIDIIFPDVPPPTTDKYVNDVFKLFKRLVNENRYVAAVINLQKKLPLLAESIVLKLYEENVLSQQDFSELFKHVYTKAKKEGTIFGNELSYEKTLEIFRFCSFDNLMEKEEKHYFQKLPSVVDIYRGISGRNEEVGKKGISWTLCVDKANEFGSYNMNYFSEKYYLILSARIPKKDIIAYFHSSARYEHEVIIDFQSILNLSSKKFN